MISYIDSFPSREIRIKGKNYLYFGGTSYLGLQTDIEFQGLFVENIKKFGTNYGASRKSNIRMSIFHEVEQYLSKLVGSEACITMSSGYLAGQLVAQVLSTSGLALFYAPNTHSALYASGIKDKKAFKTYSALNKALENHLATNKNNIPVVFLDAVDFSGINYPEFEGLKTLSLSQIILVVDDSHGIGIVGENGGGVYRKIKMLNPKELIVSSSLGKGFGVQAGAIFGLKKRISQLGNTAFFGSSSPASPANLATILRAEKIYNAKRNLLESNMQFFINHVIAPKKFRFMDGHPTYSFLNENLTEYLERHHIIVTSFQYPDEDSPIMSRIVISAAHTEDDIIRLCNLLNLF
ncbi:aminotransferase class I/II-fold pyridoxal phosphate-dependent enzyme [Changchengzhania lutea]|uniref:aminotransferase class I/II-fold pyridoxal phosphate-dependent enzyme n=1 Tax=Changchengzhania lutea TaxID=2049305 RepID=UPI00115EEFA6|nr:aminotransferase class I/II-fold pyridoxal phosphate-dependent enzyme [Changchengzhania lutea]